MNETRQLWNAWSDGFQGAWNAETENGELPPAPIHYGPGYPENDLLGPLPDLAQADVVVLGCGGGQETIGFARHEPHSVTGIDFSTEQLEHAARLHEAHELEATFLAGDVTRLPLTTDSFDLAFSSWVFQMVDDLEVCFAEAARILRDEGAFVFAVPHPFYELFDPETGEIERSYFDGEPERKSVGEIDPDLTVYHRTVGEIHQALTAAGLVVEQLLEPGTDDPSTYEKHWSHKPELIMNVPPTLVVRAAL